MVVLSSIKKALRCASPVYQMPAKIRTKPIPVTLLSGFLGSGKTTLLEHILTSDHGYHIAVIINDMSQLNIDADLVKNHRVSQTEEKLVQLQNGCICCTLRGDLLEELVDLASNTAFDYIIIESTGIAEPMQVAETFTTEFAHVLLEGQEEVLPEEEKILKEVAKLGGLSKIARLDTCVTVVDAKGFLENFETTDFLVDRYGSHGQNEEDRTICDLMVDQIEFSNVILLNKVSMVDNKQKEKILKVIKMLNPVAKVIPTNYAKVNVSEIVNTNSFDFEVALSSAGWLQSIHEMTRREQYGNKLTPKPETEEYGINNFVYKSRRPFHPERLYRLIRDKFVVIEHSGAFEEEGEEADTEMEDAEAEAEPMDEDDDGGNHHSDIGEELDDELSEEQIIKNKRDSPFGPLLRSKGFFWLASRHIIRGEWSSAGPMLTMTGGVPWFAVAGKEFYPEEAQDLIEKDMDGPFGDRRNELVFIGLQISPEKISKLLDACLVTDEEFDRYKRVCEQKNLYDIERDLQNEFEDGFESWITFDVEEEHENHNHGGHSHGFSHDSRAHDHSHAHVCT